MKTINAFSLPLALFTMLMVSIILSSLTLSYYIYDNMSSFLKYRYLLQDDFTNGIKYALEQNSHFSDSIQFNGPNKITINKKPWGIYNVVSVKGKYTRKYENKTVMTSEVISNSTLPILIVKKSRSAISLSGNTKLNGDVFVPKGRLERAYINGKTFNSKMLVNGKVGNIKEVNLVFKNEEFINRINYNVNLSNFDKIYNYYRTIDSISNSFLDKTKLFYSKNKIELSNIVLDGNIVIKSDSSIYVSNNCKIKNIIINAPIVKIESGFSGSLQIIASDSVIVNDNVEMLYPSSIQLYNPKPYTSTIELKSSCTLYGVIYSLTSDKLANNSSLISVDSNTTIYGHIYSNSSVDFKGKLFGNLTCNRVIYKTNYSYFEDVFIDITVSDKYNKLALLGFMQFLDSHEMVVYDLIDNSKE